MPGPMGGPGGRRHGPGGQKPKNAKQTIIRILKYVGSFKALLFIVAGCILISSLASIASSYLIKPLINDYIAVGDLGGCARLLVKMGAIYLAGVMASYAYSRIMMQVSANTLEKIRVDLFDHMEDLPISYFDKNTHGEIMSRYTNDMDTLRQMISQSLPNLFSSAITIVGVFCAMIVTSWMLTVFVLLFLALTMFVMAKIGSKSAKFFMKQQKDLGAVNGYIEEIIDGQKVVKVFNHEEKAMQDFDKVNDEFTNSSTKANIYASLMGPVSNNLSHIQYACLSCLGALLVIAGKLDVGSVAAFLNYSKSFTNPISQITQQMNSIFTALAGAERIFGLIDEKPEVDDGYVTLVNAEFAPDGTLRETEKRTGVWAWKHPHKSTGITTYTQVKGEVSFEDVVFGYEPNKIVLNGISLNAKVGEKIAFVGSTGAGKTTITNLINRFYDVPDGKIRYDGININKIKKDDLRRSLSMVLQDTHLFTGTVMDNIRYGKLDATDEECIAAAKLANADFFISHLPDGYNTVLTGDGTNLSQGQRQLIAIARAAVADPPVLILDEATSSIDTRTEALIEKGMDSLMEGRTVFVIAHRLSTVRNSNVIIVLEHGKIIEQGNHESLIAEHGKYYQLYTGAFELS
ncbi:MAG: ABC transporter ATP-binding protein [Clostridia bacterium]|nr:ABC transporter ATP-binding protein [Clostridia bacterium]